MRNIRKKYPYNKVHTSATCAVIMKHLVDSDEARDIRKAKFPSGMLNAVEEGLNYLGALVGSQKEECTTYGEASATAADSDSLARQSTRRHHTKERKLSRRSSPSRSTSRSPT